MKRNIFGKTDTRRCRICNQPIFAICDRTKKSELVPFKTGRGQEPITIHRMYPTAEKQDDLCFRCKHGNDLKVGKQSGPTIVPFDKIDGNRISN